MLFPAVKVNVLGTTVFGAVGVLLALALPVSNVPVPELLIVLNGRVHMTVFADVAVLMTCNAINSGDKKQMKSQTAP